MVIPRIKVADTFLLRGVGLMGRRQVPEAYGAGLFFSNCRALHTCFMRFPLDVLFLDASGQPLELKTDVPPWTAVKGPKGTCHCLEVQAGTLPESLSGRLTFRPLGEPGFPHPAT